MRYILLFNFIFIPLLLAQVNGEDHLKNMFKSTTLSQIECIKDDLEIKDFKPVKTNTWSSFTWTAKCKQDFYKCSGTENGPVCFLMK